LRGAFRVVVPLEHRIWTLDSSDQTISDIPIVFSDEATRMRT
jgi:hypothetical protein